MTMGGLTTDDLVLLRERRRRQRAAERPPSSRWEDGRGVYVNRETGRPYQWHHERERAAVFSDVPRHLLFKGGEGGGKSVAGIIKDLERLRRGMHGIMVSPDMPHFKRSLWPEFVRWCPVDAVVPEQRYRLRFGWEPREPFMLSFVSGASLLCGGIEDPASYEGPNVHFAHMDEARRSKSPEALKVLTGRVRLAGPGGEPPQLWLTTTPRKHWLFEYFGPWDKPNAADPFAAFKRDALVVDLLTADNAANLADGYVEQRRAALTEAEARVLLEAAWEDIDDVDRFLPSMALWDACREELPPLDPYQPLVLALDAAVSGDTFGAVAVGRHPARENAVAVRGVWAWEPNGGVLDHIAIERDIRQILRTHNIVQVTYDPYQLHLMAQRLANGSPETADEPSTPSVWAEPFNQAGDRLEADRGLLDLIVGRNLAHDGDERLRAHIANADRKVDGEERKIRIVKRSQGLKIDLAVCASMASARALSLNLW